jgi:alanyl-tRNA synthetase
VQSDLIRRRFLEFFEARGHRVVPSSSLIPPPETGLLLTTAGMVQFIPYMLGLTQPPYPRAATSQKSFRAVDIENVGHTDRHLSFFEMLGNFSFGDYFKRDAIVWGHQLVTEGYGIEQDRLWVTVYDSDDESRQVWLDEARIPPDRVLRRGRFDDHGEPANFWWTHAAGPCGPCSEIFVDRGAKYGKEGGPNVDEERFVEIWNLVFMQDRCDDEANVLEELPQKNIDTGSSLERVAMVLQDVSNVFETDLFRPMLDVAEAETGHRYGADERVDVSLRVMAEHGRACTFLMADGVLPSNEGRGYVLRRMLRRLVTHARRMGVDRPVVGGLVEATIDVMGEAYPELRENQAFVMQVAQSEEEHFGATYQRGMALFEDEVRSTRESGATRLPGEAAFRLHDTFGFQLPLVQELAAEEGLEVDAGAFDALMQAQRRRAQDAQKKGDAGLAALGELARSAGPTDFLGYERLSSEATVRGLVVGDEAAEVAGEGQEVRLVLDRTPFYAEGGGQVGDAGVVRTSGATIEITDTRPGPGDTIVHTGTVRAGEVRVGDRAEAEVDAERREATARSHTGTHVLHHTLRERLGEHARQAGSLIVPGRLRFDFTHFEALSQDALEEIEYAANERLAADQPVRAYETSFDFARSQGATALFGEKYGDLVRVVEIGDYSRELCGGTHVRHTGEIAVVRLLSEASIGSGFRRIEALTGPDALRHVNAERRLLQDVAAALGASDPAAAAERVRQVLAENKRLQAELGKLHRGAQEEEAKALAGQAEEAAPGVWLVSRAFDGSSVDEVRELALKLRQQLEGRAAAAVLGTVNDGRANIVVSVTADLLRRGITAPQILAPAAERVGGRGGGKEALAIGGGPNAGALGEATAAAKHALAALAVD